jgi:hypothetical protein
MLCGRREYVASGCVRCCGGVRWCRCPRCDIGVGVARIGVSIVVTVYKIWNGPGGTHGVGFCSFGDAVELGEVGVDSGDRGFLVLGVVDADVGEDVEGVLPVCAGRFGLVQGAVGVGESVVGAGLVLGLAQFAGERESLLVVGKGILRVADGVPYPAKALPCFELPVAIGTGWRGRAVVGSCRWPIGPAPGRCGRGRPTWPARRRGCRSRARVATPAGSCWWPARIGPVAGGCGRGRSARPVRRGGGRWRGRVAATVGSGRWPARTGPAAGGCGKSPIAGGDAVEVAVFGVCVRPQSPEQPAPGH